MKNIIFILSMIFSATAFARPIEELKIHDVRMERQKESLFVSFTLEVPEQTVRSNYKQYLIPVIYNGENGVALTVIEVTGPNKARREKQEQRLSENTQQSPRNIKLRNGEIVAYETTVPYDATWMTMLSLRIDRKEEGCCDERILATLPLINGARINPETLPTVNLPIATIPGQKTSGKNFVVFFRFNRADIDTTFMDNNRTLNEVFAFLKQGNAMDSKIKIAGYASPEGNEAWNGELAYKRAEALAYYLVSHGWATRDSVAIVYHAINWDGLRTLLDTPDMPFKADVLNVLNNTADVETTNRKLRQLQGGQPYHYLKGKVYPKLRVASFGITNFNN